MITYNEAITVIKEQFNKIKPVPERVNLLESSGRILYEDIIADINLPHFNNSAMDGFAITYSPFVIDWNILGSISAGNYKELIPGESTAVEIMTGAKVPDGFDTVIPVEDVNISGNKIKLKEGAEYRNGMNIRKAGEDISAGKVLLCKSTIITAKEIAALAAIGKGEINVVKRLKAGVLTTGDELIDISDKPSADKIRASNLYAILGALRDINFEPMNLGIIKDDKDKLRDKIKAALSSDIDILITTGGVSAGKYDFLKEIFIEAGVNIFFHKVNIKPGKPVLFGIFNKGEKIMLVFGLPGNPVSALVGFKIFIETGCGIKKNIIIPAILGNDISKKDSKFHFIMGRMEKREDAYIVSSGRSQSSGNIAQMAQADCLILVKEDVINPRKGDRVNCIMM